MEFFHLLEYNKKYEKDCPYLKGGIMYSFLNDYNEIAHPNILKSIEKNNLIQTEGYGDDEFSLKAKDYIKKEFSAHDSEVFLFIGGTSTNLTTISFILRSYEAILSPETGHICVHEAGAIEATGHKILSVPSKDGKLDLIEAEKILNIHLADDHMILPRAVYISQSTEVGTVYTLKELKNVWDFCKKNDLYLFVDGARLGSGLTSRDTDITPDDLAKYSDLFYIGGTKNGSPIGEALVINNKDLINHFFRHMKQKGAVLAKGKILGICYEELFKDGLFWELSKHSNKMAYKIYDSLKNLGVKFKFPVQSNQIFVILNNEQAKKLSEKYAFSQQGIISENEKLYRFVTSWATDEQKVDDLIEDFKKVI